MGKGRIIGFGLMGAVGGVGEWGGSGAQGGGRWAGGSDRGRILHGRRSSLGGARALPESARPAVPTSGEAPRRAPGPRSSLTRTLLGVLGEESVPKALSAVPLDVGMAFHSRRSQSPAGRGRDRGSPGMEMEGT